MKNRHALIAFCVYCASLGVPAAFPQTSEGDVHRSIDDSANLGKFQSVDSAKRAEEGTSSAIDSLAAFEISGDYPMVLAIERYWQRFIGKPVRNDDLLEFKLWFAEESKKHGLLAFVFVEGKVNAEGQQVLVISLTSPKIQSVKLLVSDASVAERYRDLLVSRLSKDFAIGAGLDIDGLDQRLERISFDLPINLEATVRPVGPELVDLMVSVNEVDREPGEIQRMVLQFNNHGLKQFGREQLVGLFSVGGYAPHSSANITALVSQGLRFSRVEYETPAEVLSGRVRVFGSYSHSQNVLGGNAATKGLTKEFGIGLTRQENNWGDLLLRSGLEVAARRSVNRLVVSNAETGNIQDKQIRINLSLDNERVRRLPKSLEGVISIGQLSPSSLDSVAAGQYYKLNVRASLSHPLTTNGNWFSVYKARAQLVSRSVDSYNKISIGGNQGVRSYTSADGVGDVGVVGSLEVNHRFSYGSTVGIFYDAGHVNPSKSAIAGVFDQTYSLQSIGVHFSGTLAGWQYSGYAGKGLGGYKLAEQEPSAAESKPNSLRIAIAISRTF